MGDHDFEPSILVKAIDGAVYCRNKEQRLLGSKLRYPPAEQTQTRPVARVEINRALNHFADLRRLPNPPRCVVGLR